jgi:hypothetical protein
MFFKNKIFLSGSVIAIVVGVLVALVAFKKTEIPVILNDNQVATTTWLTYTNNIYGFQFMYPDTWQVTETESIPVINIYKKDEMSKPPFTLHSTTTAISIFPEGLGTEGPQSETKPSTLQFSEPTKTAIDYILQDSTTWATFVFFNTQSLSKKWSEYAFIWAGVHVDNEKVECITKDGTSTEGICEFGIESTEAKTIRSGSTNKVDRVIQEQILKSFKFNK